MKIDVYTVCWNEEIRLPYFLRHYEQFANNIVVFDNESSDGSRKMVEDHPKGILKTYSSNGQIRDDLYLQIKNNVWKTDKTADWVIIVDVDELFYAKDIIKFLENAEKNEYTIIKPKGLKFWSENSPTTSGQIYEEIYMAKECLTKMCCFRPKEIQEINYLPGCHNANPTGNVKILETSMAYFLHFHFIGKEFIDKRREQYKARLSEWNKKYDLGTHYMAGKEGNTERFEVMRNNPEYTDIRKELGIE